ncbi:MAG: hypothetical protein MI806_08765 [Minwuiales bacterium]|nr:hypothetical protein [Minwuiales bacterium]
MSIIGWPTVIEIATSAHVVSVSGSIFIVSMQALLTPQAMVIGIRTRARQLFRGLPATASEGRKQVK